MGGFQVKYVGGNAVSYERGNFQGAIDNILTQYGNAVGEGESQLLVTTSHDVVVNLGDISNNRPETREILEPSWEAVGQTSSRPFAAERALCFN